MTGHKRKMKSNSYKKRFVTTFVLRSNLMEIEKNQISGLKKLEILYSDIVHNTRQLRESFLKQREFTGIEKYCIKHLDIENILNYVKKAWDH